MQVKKIFNNNVLLALEGEKEQVLIGRGIGFQKHTGDAVDMANVEQVFAPTTDSWMGNFKKLVADIDPEYFEVAATIIKEATERLQTQFNENMLISLTDHIHFAVYRMQNHIEIHNEILWEIKRIYRNEFQIGLWALDLINQHFGVQLPEDEAGFIGIKFVENSMSDQDGDQTRAMTSLINGILDIVKYQLRLDLDEDGLNYQRFLVHLRFFARHLASKQSTGSITAVDDVLYRHVTQRFTTAFACVEKICAFVKQKTGTDVNANEQIFLTIHVQRILAEVSHQ